MLLGRFSGASTSVLGNIGSYEFFGVTFGAGQQFRTDSRGGSSTGIGTETSGGTTVQTAHDDGGSVTLGGGVFTNRGPSSAARSGTYRISGWNLEARYADGRVVRQPFFFADADRDGLYWQGDLVTLDREKK